MANPGDVFPKRNLPGSADQWGREVEVRLKGIEKALGVSERTINTIFRANSGQAATLEAQANNIVQLQTEAGQALVTAQFKTTTYYGAEPPEEQYLQVGDTWFDAGNGNQIKEWNGDSWEVILLEFEALDTVVSDAITQAVTDSNQALQDAADAQDTAGDAQDAADQAASNAAAAAGIANSKGKVIIQNTAPAVTDRLPQNLWIDTTSGNNTPKRWNGSAWVAVTDKVATDAAAAAVAAQSKADQAFTNAANAATAAGNAQTSANSKNTVWYLPTAPAGTGHKGDDLWFDTSQGNRISRWSGSAWVLTELGDAAIANLDAGKITSGFIGAARIAAGSVDVTKLTVTSIDNFIENAGFEITAPYATRWTLATGSSIVTTTPRDGARCLQHTTSTSARVVASSAARVKVDPGESYRLEAWVRMASGTSVANGITLRIRYSATETGALTSSSDSATLPAGVGTTYQKITGAWKAPANANWALFEVVTRDTTSGRIYRIDDVGMFKMASGNLIVDGAIDGKLITGATIRTAASGQRLQMDSNGLRAFNSGGSETARVQSDGTGIAIGTLFSPATTTGYSVDIGPVAGESNSGRVLIEARSGGASNYSSAELRAGLSLTTPAGLHILQPGGSVVFGQDMQDLRAAILSSVGIWLGGDTEVDGYVSAASVSANSYTNASGGRSAPYAMAAGRYSTSNRAVGTGGGVSQTVTLPAGRFTQPPNITVTLFGSARLQAAVVTGWTATSFTVGIDNHSGANVGVGSTWGFNWQAMQTTSSSANG